MHACAYVNRFVYIYLEGGGGGRGRSLVSEKDKVRKTIPDGGQKKKWVKYFEALLNRPAPHDLLDTPPAKKWL